MNERHCERLNIEGLQERPDWWRVRVEEIEQAIKSVRKGHVRQIATTPAGYAVHAVAYGQPAAEKGTATWASGSNSQKMESYCTHEGQPQVVALVCGVHGAEPEAIIGALSLMSLLETGSDLRGRERPGLVELASKYRLIIFPCVNMDGRAVSPDHLHGASKDDFVRASQGFWDDGSLVGWPQCKAYVPLPLERVGFPGGYPNSAGYNIMHDCCPGDMRTDEASGLLKLIADEQADMVLHMHSYSAGGMVLGASVMAYPLHVRRAHAYKQRVHDALDAAGLRPAKVQPIEQRGGINLCTASMMASGGLSMVFEQDASAGKTFDEALETFYVTIETYLSYGLDEPFSPRDAVARGLSE